MSEKQYKRRGRPRKVQNGAESGLESSTAQNECNYSLVAQNGAESALQENTKNYNSSIAKSSSASADEIQTILQNNLQWFGRTQARTDDEIEYRIRELFTVCADRGEIPTMEKIALCLGVHIRTIEYWISGGTGSTPRRKELLSSAKMMIQAADAELAMRYKINSAAYIFRAKNYYGMSDNQTLTIQPKESALGDTVDQNELARRIEGSVVIDE